LTKIDYWVDNAITMISVVYKLARAETAQFIVLVRYYTLL